MKSIVSLYMDRYDIRDDESEEKRIIYKVIVYCL